MNKENCDKLVANISLNKQILLLQDALVVYCVSKYKDDKTIQDFLTNLAFLKSKKR